MSNRAKLFSHAHDELIASRFIRKSKIRQLSNCKEEKNEDDIA
jgi:hypothetical protein